MADKNKPPEKPIDFVCPTPGCGYVGPGEPFEFAAWLGCLGSVASILSAFAGGPSGSTEFENRRCPKCRKWMKPPSE